MFIKLFIAVLLVGGSMIAETPTSSDAFVSSVGVNTHFSFVDSIYYQNFPLILSSIQALHVRHIRDGLSDFGSGPSYYYTNHNALAAAGIGCDYIVSLSMPQSTIAAYPSRVQDIEAFEAANEIDNQGDPTWLTDILTQIKWMFPLTQSLNLPLIGPAFVNSSSYVAVGNISPYMSSNNVHNYFAGFEPETNGWGGNDAQGHGYGSLAWDFDNTNADGPNVPVWSTETGYDQNIADLSGIPQGIYATYVGRLLLNQWNAGVRRTYLYELADDPSTTPPFGLMDNQGNRRPAFTALASLLNLLQDPGTPFNPATPFVYSLAGDTSNIEHTLLQKRDGTIFLALWIAEPVYDPNAKLALSVPSQAVTVTLPSDINSASLYSYDSNWNLDQQTLPITAGQVTVTVTGNVSLLQLVSNPEPPPPVTGWVQIISKNSGKCLDVVGGSNSAGAMLDQFACSGVPSQAFELNAVPGGYEITAENSSLQLNVANNLKGDRVMQDPYAGGTNQVWELKPASSGYYTLTVLSSGQCLDIIHVSRLDGAGAEQWTCNGGSNQQWKFVP